MPARLHSSHTYCWSSLLPLYPYCLRQELADIGAQDLIVAGMNANGTSASVMRAGAAALTSLGLGEEAGRACVDELRSLAGVVGTDVSEASVGLLGDAVQKLGNLVLIDGVVTASSASSILKTLSGARGAQRGQS